MNYDENDLIRMIETRLKTTMIGSISRMEQSFGYLWNHGDDPLNDTQELFLNKWETLRSDILNHGNNQIRCAVEDMIKYFQKQNQYKYTYNFKINQDRR